jgi:nucleotide-binding universal stress UspA family protein
MKILVPVDASKAALAPVAHLAALKKAGVEVEALVLNVQPKFHAHVARFTSRSARETLRAERSRDAMARAIEELSTAGVPFRAMTEVGLPAERIAAVAEREQVDEIMMGVGRHPAWLRWVNPSIAQGVMARTDIGVTVFARGQAGMLYRYALPAGVAGLAALLLTVE